MARTKQKLINYHSSGTSSTNVFNPANVEYGEIAVRHNHEEPRLYVRTGVDTYATFVDSAQTIVMIEEKNENTLRDLSYISGSLISVSGAFVTLSGDFETVSAQVVTNKNNITTITTDLGNLTSDFTSFSAYIETDYKNWEDTKNYIDRNSENLTASINYVSGQVSAFSSTVVTQYATKTEVASASANAISSAKTYVDAVSGNIESHFDEYINSANMHTIITGIETNVNNLETGLNYVSGQVSAFSSTVATQYATKTEVASASANAISSAKTYIDAASGNIESHFGEYINSANMHTIITGIETNVNNLDTGLAYVSGQVDTLSASVSTMETDLIDRIESALTVVYKFKGTVPNYSDLANISNPQNGDVYNVVNAQGTIGEATYVPPGTNYAWVEDAETPSKSHWDELGGQVDLSNYVTQGELSAATATTENVMNAVNYISGQVSAFSSTVVTQYATKTEVASASANAISSAKTYIDAVSGNIESHFGEYINSANMHTIITGIETDINNLETGLNYVSGQVSAFSSTVATQYATKTEVASASANAISSAKTYIDAVSGNIESHFGEYVNSANMHTIITGIETNVNNLDTGLAYVSGQVDTLSASVISIKADADKALDGFELTGSGSTKSGTQTTQSGAKANYTTGGTATLDLSELVIDCGDF